MSKDHYRQARVSKSKETRGERVVFYEAKSVLDAFDKISAEHYGRRSRAEALREVIRKFIRDEFAEEPSA